jgi:hypothetical protein
LPDLELEDIKAALLYAVRELDHPVLAAWQFGWMLIYRQPLLCGLLLLLVKYISDRRYFSIVLGIVPQLRYNYKLSRCARLGRNYDSRQSMTFRYIRS